MRYTPFLDEKGITFAPDVDGNSALVSIIDQAANIIDACLAEIEHRIDWGEYQGRRRKPCPEQPLLLAGRPIGQYHCPVCGMMIMAAVPHLSPAAPKEQDPDYPLGDYEDEYGCPWPPGYEETEAVE